MGRKMSSAEMYTNGERSPSVLVEEKVLATVRAVSRFINS